MNACAYTIHALGWSFFGALMGVLIDRTLADLRRAISTEAPVNQNVKRRFGGAVVPAVLVVLAIVTALSTGINANTNNAQDEEDRRIQQCQLAYANGFADALDARSDATTAAQLALDDLMTEIGALAAAPSVDNSARFQAALSEYLAKRAEARKQQQENPYPPAPRDLCK